MITRHLSYDLTRHNTFGMKVSCAEFVDYSSADDLIALDFKNLRQPVVHIGGGSNLLFTGDFPGTVLHSSIKYIKYVDMGLDELLVAVGAGVCFDDFVAEVCGHGLWGAENLSLIPGEVGAAAVQNIGAYGAEVKDIIKGVVCFDTLTGEKCKFTAEQCDYGYRDSIFKHSDVKGRYIITAVLFRLSRTAGPKLDYKGLSDAFGGKTPSTPQEVREAVIKIRQQKLPDPSKIGSAGSFFKNPVISKAQFDAIASADTPHYDLPYGAVKVPAAWLIDQCGLKGAEMGGAAVYEKQPLVIINKSGNATPQDIISLEKHMIETVKNRFGIRLSPEVEHI